MKISKKLLSVAGAGAVCAVACISAEKIYIRKQSEKYNLITLDTLALPEPVSGPAFEGDAELSEVTVHYTVYGDRGHDLVLVHGNRGDKNSLSEAARYLARDYKVYVTESRCHGQSSDPGEISYELMAKDLKEFIEAMGMEKPYLVGHSDGAINALTVAYMYPGLLAGVISCGANSAPKALKPYFTTGVKIAELFRPDKLNRMMLTLPQMNEKLLSQITCPAYIVAGENDIMHLSDTVFIRDSIKNSKIAIIKSADHCSYISADGKQAYVLVKEFFDSLV